MSYNTENAEIHVRSFRLEASEAVSIIKSGRPLGAEQLQKMDSSETYSPSTFDRLTKSSGATEYTIAESIGSLVFPTWFEASVFICFCTGYKWCLLPDRNGQLRYYLKCTYFCVSRGPQSIAS